MKKFISLIMVLCCVLTLTACGGASTTVKDDNSSIPSNTSAAREQKAEDSFMAIVNAEDVATAAYYMEKDTEEQLQEVLDFCRGKNFRVDMEYIGEFDDKDVFKCKLILADNSILDTRFVAGMELDDRYVFCEKQEFIEKMAKEILCGTCNGSGAIYSGGTACAICAGTGWWFNPSAYFDAGLNQWMGQNQACGGCAGMGYLNQTTHTCTNCHGIGVILN